MVNLRCMSRYANVSSSLSLFGKHASEAMESVKDIDCLFQTDERIFTPIGRDESYENLSHFDVLYFSRPTARNSKFLVSQSTGASTLSLASTTSILGGSPLKISSNSAFKPIQRSFSSDRTNAGFFDGKTPRHRSVHNMQNLFADDKSGFLTDRCENEICRNSSNKLYEPCSTPLKDPNLKLIENQSLIDCSYGSTLKDLTFNVVHEKLKTPPLSASPEKQERTLFRNQGSDNNHLIHRSLQCHRTQLLSPHLLKISKLSYPTGHCVKAEEGNRLKLSDVLIPLHYAQIFPQCSQTTNMPKMNGCEGPSEDIFDSSKFRTIHEVPKERDPYANSQESRKSMKSHITCRTNEKFQAARKIVDHQNLADSNLQRWQMLLAANQKKTNKTVLADYPWEDAKDHNGISELNKNNECLGGNVFRKKQLFENLIRSTASHKSAHKRTSTECPVADNCFGKESSHSKRPVRNEPCTDSSKSFLCGGYAKPSEPLPAKVYLANNSTSYASFMTDRPARSTQNRVRENTKKRSKSERRINEITRRTNQEEFSGTSRSAWVSNYNMDADVSPGDQTNGKSRTPIKNDLMTPKRILRLFTVP